MAIKPASRDMSVVLQMGSILVSWTAEGVSWSPDVADDMTARCMQMLRESIAEAAAYGILQTDQEVIADDGSMAETGVDEDG